MICANSPLPIHTFYQFSVQYCTQHNIYYKFLRKYYSAIQHQICCPAISFDYLKPNFCVLYFREWKEGNSVQCVVMVWGKRRWERSIEIENNSTAHKALAPTWEMNSYTPNLQYFFFYFSQITFMMTTLLNGSRLQLNSIQYIRSNV